MIDSEVSLFRFSVGPTISLSCSIRAAYGDIGSVFALIYAQISKNLFQPYHEIESLAQKFPGRVKILGSLVEIQGPVLISDGGFGTLLMYVIFSIVITGFVTSISYKVIDLTLTFSKYKNHEDELPKPYIGVLSTIGIATFICSYVFFIQRIPIEQGVHLLNWSFRKIN
jgi:hypothetical protein